MSQASSPPPFRAERYQLAAAPGRATGRAVLLAQIEPRAAEHLAAGITAIDPWHRMGYAPSTMAAYLRAREDGAHRFAIRRGDDLIGAVVVRYPWLRGPYLELIALLPGAQGRGLGGAVIAWMARQAQGSATSLWVCVSTFNERGQAFYAANGFQPVADLPGLVAPPFTEILMRKQLAP